MSGSGQVRKKKLVRQAVRLKQDASKDFTLLIALACVFFGLIALYTFVLKAGLIDDQPLAQGVALVAAIAIGMVSLRHSKKRRKFLDFLDDCGLTKEDVSTQIELDRSN